MYSIFSNEPLYQKNLCQHGDVRPNAIRGENMVRNYDCINNDFRCAYRKVLYNIASELQASVDKNAIFTSYLAASKQRFSLKRSCNDDVLLQNVGVRKAGHPLIFINYLLVYPKSPKATTSHGELINNEFFSPRGLHMIKLSCTELAAGKCTKQTNK